MKICIFWLQTLILVFDQPGRDIFIRGNIPKGLRGGAKRDIKRFVVD